MKVDVELKVKTLNKLYHRVTTFCYNGNLDYNYVGQLRYGIVPTEVDHREYHHTAANYDKLVSAIESGAIKTGTIFVDKPLLSKKKSLYEASWYEAFKLKEKNFINAVYDDRYVTCAASIAELVKYLPVDDLMLWLKDNSVTLKELSKVLEIDDQKINKKVLID